MMIIRVTNKLECHRIGTIVFETEEQFLTIFKDYAIVSTLGAPLNAERTLYSQVDLVFLSKTEIADLLAEEKQERKKLRSQGIKNPKLGFSAKGVKLVYNFDTLKLHFTADLVEVNDVGGLIC